jgi:hypothetical protein
LVQETRDNAIQVRNWYSETFHLAEEVSHNAEDWFSEGIELESAREDEAYLYEEGMAHLEELHSLGLTDDEIDDYGDRD